MWVGNGGAWISWEVPEAVSDDWLRRYYGPLTPVLDADGHLVPEMAKLAAVEAIMAEHWDWKSGRMLHAAIRRALDGEGGTNTSDLLAQAWDDGRGLGLRQADYEYGVSVRMPDLSNPYRQATA